MNVRGGPTFLEELPDRQDDPECCQDREEAMEECRAAHSIELRDDGEEHVDAGSQRNSLSLTPAARWAEGSHLT